VSSVWLEIEIMAARLSEHHDGRRRFSPLEGGARLSTLDPDD